MASRRCCRGAVGAAALCDGAIVGAKLAIGAVGTLALGDGAVVSGKLANGAVGAAALCDGAIGSAKLANGAGRTGAEPAAGKAKSVDRADAGFAPQLGPTREL